MPPEQKKHNFSTSQVQAMKAAYEFLAAVIEPNFGKAGGVIFPKFSEEYERIEEILKEIESLLGVKTFKKK